MRLTLGLILFLAAWPVIAFGGAIGGTAVGTTMGIAGLGLMAWGWLTRQGQEEHPPRRD